MAIKEILDILGENPTESVYSEGKDFVTKKIKLYIDKKKLENYVKETYNRRTKVYASKKFAYEGFMVYISSKAFLLHCPDGCALVDGGKKLHALTLIASVVDTNINTFFRKLGIA